MDTPIYAFYENKGQQTAKRYERRTPKKLNNYACIGPGIKNIVSRTRFYYSDDCGTSFEDEAGKGTKSTVKINSKIFCLSIQSEGEA